MSIVLKSSNNITLFSYKNRLHLSPGSPLLGELTVTLSTNMAVSKAHMASLLESYKTKKERQTHESTSGF